MTRFLEHSTVSLNKPHEIIEAKAELKKLKPWKSHDLSKNKVLQTKKKRAPKVGDDIIWFRCKPRRYIDESAQDGR